MVAAAGNTYPRTNLASHRIRLNQSLWAIPMSLGFQKKRSGMAISKAIVSLTNPGLNALHSVVTRVCLRISAI